MSVVVDVELMLPIKVPSIMRINVFSQTRSLEIITKYFMIVMFLWKTYFKCQRKFQASRKIRKGLGMQVGGLDCCWKYKVYLYTCFLAGFGEQDLASDLNYDVTRDSRLSAYINIFKIMCRKFHVSNIFRLIIKQICKHFKQKSCEKA